MKKITLYVLFCTVFGLCSTCVINAQDKSIGEEILQYSNSKSDIILKGRRMLLDKFVEGDIDQVKVIKDYLCNEVEDNDYLAFYPVEYWLILYWTQEYETLATHILNFETDGMSTFKKQIKPMSMGVYEKILDKTRASKELLELEVLNSSVSEENKAFLKMHLNYIIADEDYEEIDQDMLNAMANDFLKRFPLSTYGNYTRKNIRYQMSVSDWGYGVEFFSGYGVLTSTLGEAYGNNIPFGVAFDVEYKKFTLYLRDYIGFSKSKKDIYYDLGIWEKGQAVNVFVPEISAGYSVLNNNLCKVSPFMGISSTEIGPAVAETDKNPDLSEAALTFTTTYTLGMNVDFKLHKTYSNSYFLSNYKEVGYWYLRLRYSYHMPQFYRHYPDMTGNMHNITIGIGGSGRRVKREY